MELKDLLDKSKHIFEHGLMTYVVDFAIKTCWLIDLSDKKDPILALELQRVYPSRWFYRNVGSEDEFIENYDDEWADCIESKYKDYIQTVIASEDEVVRK